MHQQKWVLRFSLEELRCTVVCSPPECSRVSEILTGEQDLVEYSLTICLDLNGPGFIFFLNTLPVKVSCPVWTIPPGITSKASTDLPKAVMSCLKSSPCLFTSGVVFLPLYQPAELENSKKQTPKRAHLVTLHQQELSLHGVLPAEHHHSRFLRLTSEAGRITCTHSASYCSGITWTLWNRGSIALGLLSYSLLAFPQKNVTERGTTQGNMLTEATERAELFLSAHQGPLVQRGWFQHAISVSTTARNSPSDAHGGAGDDW